MDSTSPRVQCQATLALRNLASDAGYQLEIVRAGGLPHLKHFNTSFESLNEGLIIDAGFLKPLVALLEYNDSEEIQCHAVSTLRNLADRLPLLDANAVLKCKELVLNTPVSVQSVISACFAILALPDDLKIKLLDLGLVEVLIPLTFSSNGEVCGNAFSSNGEVCGNAAAALANLCSRINDYRQIVASWEAPNDGILGFLIRFLNSENPAFEHIAPWSILQLLESGNNDVTNLLTDNETLVATIKKLADANFSSSQNSTGFMNSQDQFEDPKIL